MSVRPMGEEELLLTVAEAERLPEVALREQFWVIATDLVGTYGEDMLPVNFPKNTGAMTRAEILAAIREHAYWFDLHGGRPMPPMREDAA